jgi:hypothetical protein
LRVYEDSSLCYSVGVVSEFCSVVLCLVWQEQDKAITLKRFEFERECKELHNQYEERMKVCIGCSHGWIASAPPPHQLRPTVAV